MIGNTHRDPKRRPKPFTIDDFNPFAERKRDRDVKDDERVSVGQVAGMLGAKRKRAGE